MTPTLVFLLRKSHGQRSLVGNSPWGHKESDLRAAEEQWHPVKWLKHTVVAILNTFIIP